MCGLILATVAVRTEHGQVENPRARGKHCHISWTKGTTLRMSSALIRLSLEVNKKPDFFVFCPISNHSRKEQEDAPHVISSGQFSNQLELKRQK